MGLRDKLKFDMSKTEDKLKLFILISGTLLFLLVATVGGISLTMSPDFCKLCHKAMTPEYVTWKYSSHSQIACVDCHMEPGVVNILLEKMVATKHLYTYLTNGYEEEMPLHMKRELPSHLCEQCHSIKTRTFTLSGDLKDPHEYHEKVGVGCVKCHSGVAHGNIAGRAATKAGDDLAAWNDEDGKKNMIKEYVRPDMDTCVSCHLNPAKYGVKNIKSVSWSCETCHKSIFTPKTHTVPTWLNTHGLDAENDLKTCVSCHAMGVKPTYAADGVKNNIIKSGAQAKGFAWTSEFCINCHSKKPKNHEDKSYWMPNHKNAVASKQMKNCVACHSIQKPKGGETLKSPAKEVACNKCHWFSQKD
ncbi:MAG: cytochrome c3 family protein [Eubacteriales bacterium]